MSKSTEVSKTLTVTLINVVVLSQEFVCDFDKSFLGPLHKPINSGVIDEGGVESDVVPEGFTNWRHADGQVHVVLNLVEEPLVHDIGCIVGLISKFVGVSHLFTNSRKIIVGVEIGHDSSVEHVLNVFEEGFLCNIIVRENEDGFSELLILDDVRTVFVHSLECETEVLQLEVCSDI